MTTKLYPYQVDCLKLIEKFSKGEVTRVIQRPRCPGKPAPKEVRDDKRS